MTDQTRSNGRFQFSLAWLVFWTIVCGCSAAVARELLARGEQGIGYLLLLGAIGVWLAVFCLAVYRRMFSRRRWQKVNQQREELRQLVQKHRASDKEAD